MSTTYENYSAADRRLDEAVLSAIREENPVPVLRRIPSPPKVEPDEEYEPLQFGGLQIRVKRIRGGGGVLDGEWALYSSTSTYADSLATAAEQLAEQLTAAAEGLRRLAAQSRPAETPSVTTATSAALVEGYGKGVAK